MGINKDLVEAILMISFICLVLTSTSDFQNMETKNIVMGVLGILTVIMAGLRYKAGQEEE